MKTKQVRYIIGLLLAMVLSSQAQTAPTITIPPTNQTVSLGANVAFSVTATGTPPLTYQWRHEETNIESRTTRTLTVTNVQLVHQGRYDVVVTNLSGSVTSQVATLTVDPTFTQITTGPIVTDTAGGVEAIWVDYDGDGKLDLTVLPADDSPRRSAVFHNEGGGTFSKVTNIAIAQPLMRAYTHVWGDYDNDGKVDLFVPNSGMNDMLFHNDGNGSFTRITNGHPVIDGASAGTGTWGDYDRDGFLDLFVVANPNQNDKLYRGNGDGTFQKMTSAEVGPIVSDLRTGDYAVWTDVDNDGWPELYRNLSVSFGGNMTNQVWHLDSQGKFYLMDIGEMQKGSEGYSGITWADYDNDGLPDTLVGAERGSFGLYRNLGAQGYTNVVASAFPTGLSNCVIAMPIDYDNDGWQDLVGYFLPISANLPAFFRNNGDGTFTPQNVGGPSSLVGGFLAWGDYDNDGFLDILGAYGQGIRNSLFRNTGNANHWLKVKLDGRMSNRSGIGAKVRVNATIGGRTFWQMREISGQGFGDDNGLIAHFGLGDATNVTTLRIEWPSGNVQELTGVTPNQFLTIQEPVNITPSNPSSSLNGSVTLTRTPTVSGSYQWQFKGADLAGQTNRTLSLTNLQSSQQGSYSVVVTTAAQTVTDYVYLLVDTTFTKITSEPWSSDLGNCYNGVVGDYNGDGCLDIFIGRSQNGRSALYQNNGDGTFRSITNSTFPLPVGNYVFGACSDFDNDGRIDLFVRRGGVPSLFFYNNGDGTFTQIPLATVNMWSMNAVDYDHDGLLDLYLTGGSTNRLYRNLGGRTFQAKTSTQVGAILGINTWGNAAWADYDDDGWEDVVVPDLTTSRCRLYRNTGTGRFDSVTNQITEAAIGGIVANWGDYDNDGRVDLCVAVFGGQSAVYRNLGGGNFERASIGVTIEGDYNNASWGDYDNDGFLDLFMTYGNNTGNSLFRNNGNGTFTAITTGSVVTDRVTPDASYAGLWFDYDNDGFLDLFVPNGNDEATALVPNYLYHNNGNANAWLKVKLVGTVSNREGAGAKVRAQAKYAGATRWQRRDITSVGMFDGMGPIAHFGLGDATNVTTLRIEWPSGIVQELQNVGPRQFLTIWEPPVIHAGIEADGSCQLTIKAEPNRAWQIQTSNDLVKWQTLATMTNANVTFQYTDTAASGQDYRFYRVTTE